ncbi:phosphate ABC transporter ATP-binding protein [Bremerella cremea]|uniref:phosphate ABC transporter ATP-binding protein n=1 Tax=Bremerella cremea TaxID=1031537 RepID=UPI0031EE7790
MIRTESLSVHYGETTAIREVSLQVPEGHVTAIVGPSGCGKSSFLLTLNRMIDLIPGATTTGRILIGGQDIYKPGLDTVQLRRRVGGIAQKPNPFPLSIRKNIHLVLKAQQNRTRAELDEITETALQDVGLWDEVKDRLDRPALQLSGGQQQRLCIARALALKPSYLLMDEPCSALDPIASAKVEGLIEDLRRRYTIVIVTHNLAQARRLADDVAVFWVQDGSGQMIEFGTSEKVFSTPDNPTSAAYLSGIQG